MAVTPPAGWVQRATNPQEYEAILDLGNFEKYEVNVNVQTGQRQIYTIDPVFQTRSLLATVNANGTVTKTDVYTNIAALTNGQTRLKSILDSSRTAANKIVESVGTEQQKTSLANQKEYGKLKSGLQGSQSPASPGGGSQDTGGPNAGANSGSSISAADAAKALGTFRDVSNFQSTTSADSYGTAWKYPENMNGNQDYMMISAYKYQVADVFAGSTGTSDINSGQIFGGANISSRANQTKERLGQVILPMPANISEANQTGWGEDSLSGLTAGMMGAASGAVKSIAQGDLFGAGSVTIDTAKSILNDKNPAKGTIQQLLTLRAASTAISKLGLQVNAEAYRSRVTGTVINPNLEMLFNGPKLRAFQFTYKLAPRSPSEAKQIRGIIKFFKKAMAPRRATVGEDAFFLGAPDVFQIKFMNGKREHPGLPSLKTCALVNFSVNYTADGFYSAYLDGQPISVEISMSFAELTPIYNDNYGIVDGDDVGFGNVDVDQLENPRYAVTDISEKQNAANNSETRTQDPNQPGAGTRPGSPVPPLVIGVDDTVGSPNNRPPLAGSPGSSLALPAN